MFEQNEKNQNNLACRVGKRRRGAIFDEINDRFTSDKGKRERERYFRFDPSLAVAN